jgi:HK97 family phage portal protein
MAIWRKTEQRGLPLSIDPNQITARPYFANYSGELINENTIFSTSAVIAAVSLLADSIAAMPLYLYRDRGNRLERGKTPAILVRPNDKQLIFEFVHQTIATLAVHGVAFIYAPKDDKGYPLELRNIHPEKVIIHADTDGNVEYEINRQRFPNDDIIQINWMIMPGQKRGVSPIDALRNTVGTMIAIDRFLASFYGEGATPSSVLETDGQITEEQARILRDSWEEAHWKRRRPAVLTGGLKWRPISASASDMDTMVHRDAIIRDIARAYRIPLHLMLGTGGDNQTYQNVEAAGINFVRHTLLPWMRRLEDALSELFPYPIVVRFDADELQRADLLTRVRAQQIQIQSGTLSPNEAREIEGLEPYEGGDNFVAPTTTPNIGVDALPPDKDVIV